jgi:hypothetical protein
MAVSLPIYEVIVCTTFMQYIYILLHICVISISDLYNGKSAVMATRVSGLAKTCF